MKFKASYLKEEDKAGYTPKNLVNFVIIYEWETWSRDLDSDFTLKNYLFGGVKLTKNTDPDEYSYSGYSIEFDNHI